MRSQSVCSEKTISRGRRTPITFRPSSRRLQFDCHSPRLNSSRYDNGKVDRICRLFGDATDVSPFPKLSRFDAGALFHSCESASDHMKQSKETDETTGSVRPFFIESRSLCSKPLVKLYNDCPSNLMSFEKAEAFLPPEKHFFRTVDQSVTVLFSEEDSLQRNTECNQNSLFTNIQVKDVVLKSPNLKASAANNLKECFSEGNSVSQQWREYRPFSKQNIDVNAKYVTHNINEGTPNTNGCLCRRVTPVLVEDFMKSQVKEKCKQVDTTNENNSNSFCLFYQVLVKRLYDILSEDNTDTFFEDNKNPLVPFIIYYKLVYKAFEKLVNNLKQADIQLIPMRRNISKPHEETQFDEYYIEDCIITVCCPYDHVENDTILCEMYRWAFLLVMFYRLHVSSCACFLSEITEPNQFFSATIITNIIWGLCHSIKGRILLLKETCQIVNDMCKALNQLKITHKISSEFPLDVFHEHFEICLYQTILSIISFIKSCPDQLVYRFHTQATVDITQPLCFVCTKRKQEALGKNGKILRKPIMSINIPYKDVLWHLSTLLKTSLFFPYKCCLLLLFCSQLHWLLLFYVEFGLSCELESLLSLSVWCFQNVCKSLHITQQEDASIPDMDSLFHRLYSDKTLYKFFVQSYNHFYGSTKKENSNKCINLSPENFLSQCIISDWNGVSFKEWQYDKDVMDSIIEMACNMLIVSGMWQTPYQSNVSTLSYEMGNYAHKSCTPFPKNASFCIRSCHTQHTAPFLHTRLQSFIYYVCMFCTSCFYTQRHSLLSGEIHSLLRLGFSKSKIYRQFARNYLKYVEDALKLLIKNSTPFSSSHSSLAYRVLHECCSCLKSARKEASLASHSKNVVTRPFSYHSVLKYPKAYFKIKTPQFMSVQENLVTLMVNLGQYEKQTYLISSLYITLEHNSKFLHKRVLEKSDMDPLPCEDCSEKKHKSSLLDYLVYLTHSLCSAYNVYERFTTTLQTQVDKSTLGKKKLKKKKILLRKLKRKHKKATTIKSEPITVAFEHNKPPQETENTMLCCPCILWLLTYCDIKYNEKEYCRHTTKVPGKATVEAAVEADIEEAVEADVEAGVKVEFNNLKVIDWTLQDTSLCSNSFFNNRKKYHSKKCVYEYRHFISNEKSIPLGIAIHCLRFICESGRAMHNFFTQGSVWIEIVSCSECPLNFLYQPLLEKKNVKLKDSASIDRQRFQYLSANNSFITILILFEALCALSRVTSHMTVGQTFFYTIQAVLPNTIKRNKTSLNLLPNCLMIQLSKSQLKPFILPLYDNIASISSRTLKSTLLCLLNQEIMTESRILAEKESESLILFRTLLVDVLSSLLSVSLKRSLIKSRNMCDQVSHSLLRSVMKLFQFRKNYFFLSINSFNNASTHDENPMCLMLNDHKWKPCSNDSFLMTSLNITCHLADSSSFTISWCLITLVHFLRCIANIEVEQFAMNATQFIEDLVLSFFPTSALASKKYFSCNTKRKQKHEKLGTCGASWISLARNKLLECREKQFQYDLNFKGLNGFDKFLPPCINPCSFLQDRIILAAYFHFEEHDLHIDKTTLTSNYLLTFFPILQISIFSIPFNKLFIFVSRIISRVGRYLTQFSDIQWAVLCSLIIHSVWIRLQETKNLNLEILCTFLSTCSLPFIATEDPFQVTFQSRDFDNLWVDVCSGNTPSERTSENKPRCVYLQIWMASLFHLLKLLQNVVYWVLSQNTCCRESSNKWNHLIKSMECVSTYYSKQIQKCVVLKQYLCDRSIDLHKRKTLKNNCFSISFHDLYTLYERLIETLREANGNNSVYSRIGDIALKHETKHPHFLTYSNLGDVYENLQSTKSKEKHSNQILQTSAQKDMYCNETPQNAMKRHQEFREGCLSHRVSCSVPPYTSTRFKHDNLLDLFHPPEWESCSITLNSDSEDFYETQVEKKSLREEESHLDDLNEWVVYDQMDLNVVQNPTDMSAKKFIQNDLNNYSLDPLWSVYIADMFCNSLH